MRTFKYSRGKDHEVFVMLSPTGSFTYKNIKCPYAPTTVEYNEVVNKMLKDAEKEIEAKLKGELNENKSKRQLA